MRAMAIQFSLCGEGLCIGYDGGDAVSRRYAPTFPFTGGEIIQVVFNVTEEAYSTPRRASPPSWPVTEPRSRPAHVR